jgi:putative ABC transport system ATP-binding protein
MIRFEHVFLSFNNTPLLRDFNLTVKEGEKVAISAPSGWGKTTLLKLLLGYVVPDQGKVLFNNMEVNWKAGWQVRRMVSYVPQNTDLGDGSVSSVMLSVFNLKANTETLSGFSGDEPSRGPLRKYLSLLGLEEEVLDMDFQTLSGGEKQRIALIVALMLNRKVFLLDEATAALDEEMKGRVVDLFASRKEWTVLVTAHDPEWKRRKEFRTVAVGGCQ